MRTSKYFVLGLLMASTIPAFSQPIIVGYNGGSPVIAQTTNFIQFSIDFPGGTPKELATALEKATGRPLNVIILDVDAAVRLPAFKLKNVCLPQLFQALRAVSEQREQVSMLNNQGFTSPREFLTCYKFDTLDHNPGNDSVWYFHVDKPNVLDKPPEKACRFFQLGPFLESGLTVDDITTAIETGWKMEGDNPPPQLSFHKETKLLIAVGDPRKLNTIAAVLSELEAARPGPIDPTTGLPVERPGRNSKN
jgi:hypothetical protein